MSSADDSSVEITWVDSDGAGATPTSAPTTAGAPSPGGQSILAAVFLALLIGGLWLAARPDSGFSAANERIVTPTTTSIDEASTSVVSSSTVAETSEVDVVDDALALGGPLRDPVRVSDGWRALRETAIGTELVQSLDGLVWVSTGAGLPPGEVLAMATDGDELSVVVMRDQDADDDDLGYEAQLWRSSDAGLIWFPDQTAASLRSDGQFYRASVGESAALVETADVVRNEQPQEIREVLKSFVSDEQAGDICSIQSVFEVNEPGYALRRCGDGSTVLTMLESEIYAGVSQASFGISECLELLGFAMKSQGRVSIMEPGRDAVTLDLPPFMFASDVLPTDDGLLAVLVDYRYFSPLVGPCLPLRDNISSGVYRWTGTEFERDESLPPHNLLDYFGATLGPVSDDGSVLLAASEGGFVLQPGATDWTAVVERPVGGGTMNASSDGSTIMYRNRNDEIWLTRTVDWLDGDGEWQKMELPSTGFATLLLGNDEGAVLAIENLLGAELIQVTLE